MTGEFMFGVTVGYEIKRGKLGRALHDGHHFGSCL